MCRPVLTTWLWQVPYQLDYVRRLVDEETAKREGRVPAQLLSQRLTSSQEASTSGQSAEGAAEADSAQFNTDVRARHKMLAVSCGLALITAAMMVLLMW